MQKLKKKIKTISRLYHKFFFFFFRSLRLRFIKTVRIDVSSKPNRLAVIGTGIKDIGVDRWLGKYSGAENPRGSLGARGSSHREEKTPQQMKRIYCANQLARFFRNYCSKFNHMGREFIQPLAWQLRLIRRVFGTYAFPFPILSEMKRKEKKTPPVYLPEFSITIYTLRDSGLIFSFYSLDTEGTITAKEEFNPGPLFAWQINQGIWNSRWELWKWRHL